MKSIKIWRTICVLAFFCSAVLTVQARNKLSLFADPFSPAPLTRDGKIIAAIDFDPKIDGFSFRNYGSNRDNSEDLDAADLIRMFGAENVCIEGSTAKDCVLYETAERWAENQIEAMGGGHCDGFSVTSLNLFVEQPFRGKSSPAQWQANAANTFGLRLTAPIANFIAYHHALQTLPEVSTFRAASFKYAPSQILQLIAESFTEDSKDLYTLGIGMRVNGQYTRGHSIVPIAIEEAGNDVYLIHVYDNNFPGQTKFVTVDTKNETWRYRTASDPNDTARDYVGNLQTKTMSLKKLSDRNRRRFDCPFSEDEEETEGATEGSTGNEGEEIHVSIDGEGSLLIADPNGKRIGYDSQKRAEINEIKGAQIFYVDGGLDQDLSPAYSLPFQPNAKNPYTITVSGKDLESEIDTNLEISGPGFVIGLEEIMLDPNESLEISIAPDFESITFTASADGETPSIYFTTEDGADSPSYSFEVGGVSIDAGKSLTMSVDIDNGKIYFMDDDGNEDAYDIEIERTNPDGTKIVFNSKDLNMKGKDKFEIDFSKWDGKNQPCVEDDDDGDGFADEDCGDAEEGN
jgi:hypothetical protein